MAEGEAKSILTSVVLALQLCLGVWQIGKFTPLGALIHCFMSWLLSPLRISSAYTQLGGFQGRVYKTVTCHVTSVEGEPTTLQDSSSTKASLELSYLNKKYVLERKDKNKMHVNGSMSYYITDRIWHTLLGLEGEVDKTVFIKGYKEFWQQVATGSVMTLQEVLDNIILDNHVIRKLDNDLLLPVNILVSEEKLLKFLNLLGLFIQTKKVYWLFPTLISLTSAILEFNVMLRVHLYSMVNLIFCFTMHCLCDNLPRPVRRQIYSLGCWVENLKPCNDIQLKVVRGDGICMVVGGGAKVREEDATLVPDNHQIIELIEDGNKPQSHTYPCECVPSVTFECKFEPSEGKCRVTASTIAHVYVQCTWPEFFRMSTFISCVAKHSSGSLKTCDSKNTVHLRGFRESVMCFAKSGYPPVYELCLGRCALVNDVEVAGL